MIPSKQRTCKGYNKECNTSFVGNSTLCNSCRQAKSNDLKKASRDKSKAKNKEKATLSQSEIDAMKGSNFKPKTTKRVKNQEELDAEKVKKAKLKAEKDKQRKKEKRSQITESKLDQVFSKLVRSIYPFKCHSTGISLEGQTVNAAHFISRTIRSTRWDLRNVYPTLQSENFYNQLHILELSKYLKSYYSIDYDDFISEAKQTTCKLTANDRKVMFDIFSDGLNKVIELRKTYSNPSKLDIELEKLRLEIIENTKKIM